MGLPPFQAPVRPVFVGNPLPQRNEVPQQQNPQLISNFRQIAPPGGQLENLENNVLDFRDENYAMLNGDREEDLDLHSVCNSEGFQVQDDDNQQGDDMYQEASDLSELQEEGDEEDDFQEGQVCVEKTVFANNIGQYFTYRN
jgi:hypothetical protein